MANNGLNSEAVGESALAVRLFAVRPALVINERRTTPSSGENGAALER